MPTDARSRDSITVPELVDRIRIFTGILLQALLKGIPDGNIVFSPYSIFTLLLLAADASAGRTRSEIADAVLNGLDFDRSLDLLENYIRKDLRRDNQFSSASAVMVRNDKKDSINPGYPEHLRKAFDGELFAGEDLIAEVNNWVLGKSRGLIPPIADDSMKEMLLCLLNACAFLAGWEKEYKPDSVLYDDFHNADGSVSRAVMLKSHETAYIENKWFTGFEKPYAGNAFSYAVLLPKKHGPLTEETLAKIDFSSCLSGRITADVRVTMPEFRISSDYDLTGICKNLGIKTAFTPQADFSPMSSEWLKADSVRHKAYIEVDREGTRAAAVTKVRMPIGGMAALHPEVKEITVDRPFVFEIVHRFTGLPVFVGLVNSLPDSHQTSAADSQKAAQTVTTKEQAVSLAREVAENRGPILDVKEYDDIYVVTFVKGWDTYIVDRETGKVYSEQDLPEEEAIRIAKRPYTMY